MQRFRRFGLLVVVSLLGAILMAACGDNTATTAPTTAATTAAAATTAKATAAATTTAAAGATTAASGGAKLKVGLVTDIGRINDKNFNEATWNGVQQANKDLGVDIKYIETADTKDYAKNIKTFVDEKYDVIVTVGFLLADATTEAAKANPNIKFIGVDQFQATPLPNLTGITFEEDKSGFLAGALAAGMSKSGKIASVLGTKSVPPVQRYGEGYKAGADYMVKNFAKLVPAGNATTTLTYHPDGNDAFTDPTWGAQQAQTLVQAGNDVVFGAGGQTGNGAIEAAAQAGVYVIGVDVDQYFTVPKAAPKMLSSATKLLTQSTFDVIKSAQSGTFKGGNFTGGSGLAPFHDQDANIPAALKDALKTIDSGLKDGSIKTGVKIG